MTTESRSMSLKEKAEHEAREMFAIFCYLLSMQLVFALYAGVLSGKWHVFHIACGFAAVNALIGAKLIAVFQLASFTHKHEQQPLIYPTLYKSLLYFVIMTIFSLIEHACELKYHHEEVWVHLTSSAHLTVVLAKEVSTFFSLLPMFAMREFERVEGQGSLYRLFIHPGPSVASPAAAVSVPAGDAHAADHDAVR